MMDARATIEHLMTLLRAALAPVVTDAYRAKSGKKYLAQMERALKTDRYNPHFADEDDLASIDVQGWLNLMIRRWEEVFREIYFTDCRSYVGELLQARNQWAHQEDFSDEDVYRILDTALRLVRVLDLTDAANQIAPLRLAWFAQLKPEISLPVSPALTSHRQAPKPVPVTPKIVILKPVNGTSSTDEKIAELAARWTKVELRAEVVRILRTIRLDADLSLAVSVAPRFMDSISSTERRLIILPPEGAHRRDARTVEDSAALKIAAKWSEGYPPASFAFLALDMDSASAVGNAVRQWLAIVHAARQYPNAIPDIHARRSAAYEAVGSALQAAYRWLIVVNNAISVVELDDDAPLIEPAVHAAQFYLR